MTDYSHQRVALRMGRTIGQTGSLLGEALDVVHGRPPRTGHLAEQSMTNQELLYAVDLALRLDPSAADEYGWMQMFPPDENVQSKWPRANQIVDLIEILDDAGSIYTVGTERGRPVLIALDDPARSISR